MSRSKKRRHSTEPANAESAVASPIPSALPSPRGYRVSTHVFTKSQVAWFRTVVAVAALWWVALLIAAVASSNPPSLSAVMIRQADCVIRFRPSDASAHHFMIEECWPNPLSTSQTPCPSLGKTALPLSAGVDLLPRTSYLVPLRKSGTEFEIPSQKADDAGNLSMVPVTPTSLRQLESILRSLTPELSSSAE